VDTHTWRAWPPGARRPPFSVRVLRPRHARPPRPVFSRELPARIENSDLAQHLHLLLSRRAIDRVEELLWRPGPRRGLPPDASLQTFTCLRHDERLSAPAILRGYCQARAHRSAFAGTGGSTAARGRRQMNRRENSRSGAVPSVTPASVPCGSVRSLPRQRGCCAHGTGARGCRALPGRRARGRGGDGSRGRMSRGIARRDGRSTRSAHHRARTRRDASAPKCSESPAPAHSGARRLPRPTTLSHIEMTSRSFVVTFAACASRHPLRTCAPCANETLSVTCEDSCVANSVLLAGTRFA
jgi:hypothetical protein